MSVCLTVILNEDRRNMPLHSMLRQVCLHVDSIETKGLIESQHTLV